GAYSVSLRHPLSAPNYTISRCRLQEENKRERVYALSLLLRKSDVSAYFFRMSLSLSLATLTASPKKPLAVAAISAALSAALLRIGFWFS
ncbi:MAG: hypothetical protein MJ074_10025, partial [Oscillospiraceae bacterium]|nr:hypothetical protein [Oscillospiraceae bacterium]